MSRQIDVSDLENLSEEDQQYLRDRGRVDVVDQLNHLASLRAAESLKVANDKIAADNVKKRYDPVLEAQQKAERDRLRVEDPESVPPYEDWSRDELLTELGARGLSKQGKNEALVARLYEDDDKNSD
jgi:hypothetical protein